MTGIFQSVYTLVPSVPEHFGSGSGYTSTQYQILKNQITPCTFKISTGYIFKIAQKLYFPEGKKELLTKSNKKTL